MIPRIFVYGTLRKGARHPLWNRLMGDATLLGHGSVWGRLFDLGSHPGAVAREDGDSLLRGELYRLGRAEATLRVLDIYEGCAPASPKPHLFGREMADVLLDGGDHSSAWVYWYKGDLAGARPIHSGDYLRGE